MSEIETNVGTNEIQSEGTNEANSETMNSVNNETNGDNNEDIFSLLYGTEEDRDYEANDSDDESDGCEDNGTNGDIKANISTNISQKQTNSDSTNNSLKRRSNETDLSQNKRIKSEPIYDTNSVDSSDINSNRLTTTCEAIQVEEQTLTEIPKNSSEFMTYFLTLNANDLDSKDMTQLSMFDKLQNVSNCLEFENLDTFCKTYIPYVLMDLWLNVKREYIQKQKNNSNNCLKQFYSILTKSKTNKMQNGLEMKCISVIKPNDTPVFRFGQLVTIQTAVQPKPNSKAHIITRNKYFAYITNHVIREFNCENQSEVNHLRLLNENKRESILIEEITFITKYSDEIYCRNDALIVAQPIICIHNYTLEARAIFKIELFPIWPQIFHPIFTSRASGLSIDDRAVDENQKECIQMALDVVANNSPSNSFIYAINGSTGSGKSSLLIEIVKQIVGCEGLRQTKVLFTSSDDNCLKSIDKRLKSNRINTYFIDNNLNINLKKSAIKYIQHKLAKDLDPHKKTLYEQCLQYLESNMESELSVESALFKNAIYDQLKHDLMNTCTVIIGRIDDLCNDISFYKYFTSNKIFNCCIVDDSSNINEPKLYSLLWFGINKFILSANFNELNREETEADVCRRFGLSRSLFERYYTLYSNSTDTNVSTVFNI